MTPAFPSGVTIWASHVITWAYNVAVLVGSASTFLLAYIVPQLVRGRPALALSVSAVLIVAPTAVWVWLRFTQEGRAAVGLFKKGDPLGSAAIWCWLTAISTAGFTALSVGLSELGFGSIGEAAPRAVNWADIAYESFIWHLLDAVPLFDIPETLNWELTTPFTDTTQGFLILAYKAFVLIPAIYLASEVVAHWLSEDERPS